MAWGFWSASTVSDRGRSPRRATTATSSAIYYQPQQQQQPLPPPPPAPQQCNVAVNQCMQPEDPNIQIMQMPMQPKQGQSVCGSPCQSVCHSPTCISPSCQSGTTESPEPQQCTDEQCQEPECQYNMQQQALQQEQLQQQQQQQQQQQAQQALQQHQHMMHAQTMQTQPHIHQIHYTYSRRTSLESTGLDPNQLSDIICRAVQPSIQSATNTLTRNSSIHDTGDYAIPQPHPHHHIITTTKSQSSLIRCGSCPGSTGVSRRGSSSESSPAGTVGNASIMGGSDGRSSVIGQGYYTDTGHYDRMPIPIPIVPAPPHHSLLNLDGMHSEDEIEPAYATVFPNPTANMPQVQQQMNYQVEDRSIYRRGARRWRKLYRINGHIFQAKRFNRKAFCTFCHDRIWGLGKQGFKCIQCKLLVHKKCHKLVQRPCGKDYSDGITTDSGEELNGNNEMPSYTYQCDLSDCSQNYMSDQEIECQTPTPIQKQYSLDDFELIRVIGRGSYAKVLMVELKKTRRIYAMKVIKKALVTDDEDIDWVQTEKHVFETASNHPFLVGLHSCFQTPSRLFFVIEFVRGGDLMFHMQRQRRLPEEHARFYAAEISLALNFLHEKGIIYRDLKLDNVLLDHEGHIKLTDYGMCKEGIGPGDTTSTFCGTPNYIAPEILRGEDYGFSVDWWALGVLLYEMLCGRSPFDISGMENAEQAPNLCQSRKRRSIHSSSFLQTTEDFLFQVILEKAIRIPRSLSVKAASVLKGFLNKSPMERLGCQHENGFLDIVNHQFFKTIDWEMLEQKQVMPPFQPRLENDRDLTNFPPEFTDEPVHLTPDDDRIIEKIDQSEFEGFEYVNPLLMTFDDCV